MLAYLRFIVKVNSTSVSSSTIGTHVTKLKHYSSKLETFHSLHPLSINSDQEYFAEQLISWHNDFLQLQVINCSSILNQNQVSFLILFLSFHQGLNS